MDRPARGPSSYSLPNLDSTIHSTRHVMVTCPDNHGITNLGYDCSDDIETKPRVGSEYLHPSSTKSGLTGVAESTGELRTGSDGVGLNSGLYSAQNCDYDVLPIFNIPRKGRRPRISRTTRIVISTSLISFGLTIMVIGVLVYTIKDIEIGFNPAKLNAQANSTTDYEAYLVHQTVDRIVSDERRYNASVGSMFMSFGALSVIIGISLLLAPAIKKSENAIDWNSMSRKKLSSIVYFNKGDLERIQTSVDKADQSANGDTSMRREYF